MNYTAIVAPDARQLSDLEATIVGLEHAQTQATSAVVENIPTRLPVSAIVLLPNSLNGRGGQLEEQHLGQLVRSLGTVPDLTPVLVLPIADHFVLIDGYHRHAAYGCAERPDIPVEVFIGTVRGPS